MNCQIVIHDVFHRRICVHFNASVFANLTIDIPLLSVKQNSDYFKLQKAMNKFDEPFIEHEFHIIRGFKNERRYLFFEKGYNPLKLF